METFISILWKFGINALSAKQQFFKITLSYNFGQHCIINIVIICNCTFLIRNTMTYFFRYVGWLVKKKFEIFSIFSIIGWRSMEGAMSCSRLHIGQWSVERDSFHELSCKVVLSDVFWLLMVTS